jgi:hypothetical protein
VKITAVELLLSAEHVPPIDDKMMKQATEATDAKYHLKLCISAEIAGDAHSHEGIPIHKKRCPSIRRDVHP